MPTRDVALKEMLTRFGTWRLGLVGMVLLAFGLGTYLAMVIPPYQYHDESAHMGYVEHLATGSLPTINSPIPTGQGNDQLDRRVASEFFRYRTDIYVGHNPPHPYAIALVPVRAARILDISGGPLLALRMMSVLGFAAAAVVTAHLARDLAGGDELMGITAGALTAGTIGFIVQVAPAGLDAPALLATTGTVWGATRFLDNPRAREAWHLGGWVAAASVVRPMSLVFALAAAGLTLALALINRRQRINLKDWFLLAGRVALPAVVVTGWWYVRNLRIYGSPSAYSSLLEKHDKDPAEETFWQVISDFEGNSVRWAHLFRGRKVHPPWFHGDVDTMITTASVLVVVLALLGVAWNWWQDRRGNPTSMSISTHGWIVMVAVSVVPWILTANHRSGGGGAHARYLLPATPLVMISLALVICWLLRGRARWVIPGLLAAYLLWQMSRVSGASAELLDPSRPNSQQGPFGNTPLIGRTGRIAALTVAGVGLLCALAATVLSSLQASRRNGLGRPDEAAEVRDSGGRNKT